MIGIIIVQHDPCRGHGRYPLREYGLMAFSVGITAVCTVRNEYIVKHYMIALNVQNSVLYASGAALNVTAFFLVPNPSSAQAGLGFFDGYDSPLAVAVVACNTLIGIAINLVYKYADAVLKCIATDCTAVVLCIISAPPPQITRPSSNSPSRRRARRCLAPYSPPWVLYQQRHATNTLHTAASALR